MLRQFCHKNHGLDPDKIRIQQQPRLRSGFGKINGSGSKYESKISVSGSETLRYLAH
jgi:hypothetical protein